MPAAAVIPAPIAYTKVVAVKKLVVEFLVVKSGPFRKECVLSVHVHSRSRCVLLLLVVHTLLRHLL